MRYVLIGFGNMGKNHYRVLSESANSEVCAIIDPFCDSVPGIPHFKSFSDFIESKISVDAAVVSTPTDTHLEYIDACIRNRTHVLVEKPISTDILKAKNLLEIAKQNNVVVFVGHVERYNPGVLLLKELIDKKVIGEVQMISASRVGVTPSPDPAISVTFDLMIHDIDVVQFLTGTPLKLISKTEISPVSKIRADISIMSLMAGDVLISLHTNWVTPFKERIMTVAGSKGFFKLDYMTQKVTQYVSSFSSDGKLELKTVEHQTRYKEPLVVEHNYFSDVVSNKIKYSPFHAVDAVRILNHG